ncbi:transmembrane protein 199 [Drosophila sechellia]|uniref:GM26419 n=1 Tax=Drosophila sechellia TaxID=7238 RepID=B4HE66_DROSE|nr:transmembrane protein 199 [Drosophila sechellia]EDW43163.1 GM26419 [Drosophila sechellia]
MLKSTIVDPRVRLVPSKKLLDFLDAQKKHLKELPENVAKIMKQKGHTLPTSIRIIKDAGLEYKRPKLNYDLLTKLTENLSDTPDEPAKDPSEPDSEVKDSDDAKSPREVNHFLYLTDLHWLSKTLAELRRQDHCQVFLHQLIETCDLLLPENEMKPRNPELEARCQRLRAEQQNRDYLKMTKNVDAGLKHYPEDTISYQIKSLNKQIIAVVQFIFSVAAGFTFGFFGVNLMVGPLPFGFRILLGVIVALIIALAEMYFLAKKLHEYDEVLDAPKRKPQPSTPAKRTPPAEGSQVQTLKPHAD